MRRNSTLRALRVMLVPFALTVLGGGAVLGVVLALTGLLPVPDGLLQTFARPAQEATPPATPAFQPIVAAPPRETPDPGPDPDDLQAVCETNARRYLLAHPDGTPVVAASRVLVPPGDAYAYIIGDGRLARVPLEALAEDASPLVMQQTEPPGPLADGIPLQELADVAYDDASNALLLLSKSGRVFRYDISAEQWSLVHTPELAPDDEADPGYLSIDASDGRAFLLDADLNQVWRFDPLPGRDNPAQAVFSGPRPGGLNAVDMLASQDVLLTVDTGGVLRRYRMDERSPTLELPIGADLPLSLQTHGGQVYVVDGPGRSVMAVDAEEDTPVSGYRLAFPQMGVLRDAAFDDEGRLLALSDGALTVYDPSAEADRPCPAHSEASPPLTYYGADLTEALAGFEYPVEDAGLPGVPRAYPGARRLYRAGVHEGLDIHPWDAPRGFDVGEAVLAMQDGMVTRADVDYQPVSNAEYNFLTEQALGLGVSLPATLDRLGGRQVFIAHEGGVSTRYLHLDSIEEGIVPGARVKRGEVIGTVGVSGTGREADEVDVVAHAHVEIWIGEHYLGEGLSLRETMWLWQQVFPTLEITPP